MSSNPIMNGRFVRELSILARYDDCWRAQSSISEESKTCFDYLEKTLKKCEQYRDKYLETFKELTNAKETIVEMKCDNAKLRRQLEETRKELAQVREEEKKTAQMLVALKNQIQSLNKMFYEDQVDPEIVKRLERLRKSSGSDSAVVNCESYQTPPSTKVRNNSDHSDMIENDPVDNSTPRSSYSDDYLMKDSPKAEMKKYDKIVPNGDIKAFNSDIECFRTPAKSVDQLIYQTPLSEMRNTPEKKVVHQWKTISSKYDWVYCFGCRKRIGFNQDYLACQHCDLKVHKSCSAVVLKPCLNNNNQPKLFAYIASPYKQPLVPDFLLQCCEEIEKRGLQTTNIYITERPNQSMNHLIMNLIHPFSKDGEGQLRRKLETLEIHSLCSMVKGFLDHLVDLHECLIPEFLCEELMREIQSPSSSKHPLKQIEEEMLKHLPLPNRDTLAFLMIHLRNVMKNRQKNGVSFETLARIFASRVIPAKQTKSNEEKSKYAEAQVAIMKYLLSISSKFWQKILNSEQNSFQSSSSLSFANYGNTLNKHDSNGDFASANGDISIDKKNDHIDDAQTELFQSPLSIKSTKSSVYGTPIGNGGRSTLTRQCVPNKIFANEKQYRSLDYNTILIVDNNQKF